MQVVFIKMLFVFIWSIFEIVKYFYYFKKFLKTFYIFIWGERGRKGEREGEKHQCVVASHVTPTREWPATQACALTGNRTGDPLVLSPCSIH